MNPQQLSLPVDQDPSEQLTNLLHLHDYSKLQFHVFRTLDYHLNNIGTHYNPTEPWRSIKTHCEPSHSHIKIV